MAGNALPLLQALGVSKSFGAVQALKPCDFRLHTGEVRALIGSNGAGKSTLIKILTGALTPSSGEVRLEDVPLPPGRPDQIIRRGVACIYQHSNLAPALSVMDNIYLGRQPTRRFGLLDRKRQRRQVVALLQTYGISLDPDAIVGTLPTVKQKEVEIAKALALDAKVLLMDEPTGWLAATEVRKLHDTIRLLKAKGVGIVYISHMLDEIFAVCDTMTIMRDGQIIAETAVANTNRVEVIEKMVGETLARESQAAANHDRRAAAAGEVRLSVRSLGRRGVFHDITLDLHAGEILCLTGLIGSKRTELVHALFGSGPRHSGTVLLDGKAVRFRGPSDATAAGIGLVPEDRHRDGLMLGMPIRDNLVLSILKRFVRLGRLDRAAITRTAQASLSALNVQPPDLDRLVRQLSGGNQQKVLVGKWLNLGPKVIILDEPTVGVDVGAKAEIYGILRRERDRGAAILVVSSDLEEVMTLADRIGIMVAGRLAALRPATEMTMKDVVSAIGAEPGMPAGMA
ncbi:MAG: sugar ABC transporter ATP-binding protein [bacterium]